MHKRHGFDCRAWLETSRITIATSWTYGLSWRLDFERAARRGLGAWPLR